MAQEKGVPDARGHGKEGEVVGQAVADEEQVSGVAGHRSVQLFKEKASGRVGCGRAGRTIEDERGWSEWAGRLGQIRMG